MRRKLVLVTARPIRLAHSQLWGRFGMSSISDDFLAAAASAVDLLRARKVAQNWEKPSALKEFSVAGLAGHLAAQLIRMRDCLAEPEPNGEATSLIEYYAAAQWIDAPLDDDLMARIREQGEHIAADGPESLAARTELAYAGLRAILPTPDRLVRAPGERILTCDDFLVTRMMELVVHADDLAVSVGLPIPELPTSTIETVVDLLSRLAIRRHGAVNVVRALSRAERAPTAITAF